MKIEQILEKIKNSAKQPRITMEIITGITEEFDNDILLSPDESKKLYEYIKKLESKGDK